LRFAPIYSFSNLLSIYTLILQII